MPLTVTTDAMVPISDFSNGKSASAFTKVHEGKPVMVLKNNRPAFFVVTPKDYERSQENRTHIAKLENIVNELINAEARREALEVESVFSSDSVDEVMDFLNSDD